MALKMTEAGDLSGKTKQECLDMIAQMRADRQSDMREVGTHYRTEIKLVRDKITEIDEAE